MTVNFNWNKFIQSFENLMWSKDWIKQVGDKIKFRENPVEPFVLPWTNESIMNIYDITLDMTRSFCLVCFGLFILTRAMIEWIEKCRRLMHETFLVLNEMFGKLWFMASRNLFKVIKT